MIEIFPTSRALREFYGSFLETDMLLPKAMSIAEFISYSILVPNMSSADEDTRVLLMQEACSFKNFSELKIDIEFLSFIKNSTYLFRFFEELAIEYVGIEDLELADTYAEFEEHLNILKELRINYIKLLTDKNLFDKITLPNLYELNEEFIGSTDGFHLNLEGFLNQYELNIFLKVSKIKPFKISLHVTKYNQKMIKLFSALGFTLRVNTFYTINLSTKEIEVHKELTKERLNYDLRGFSSKILQCSYVYEKIAEFVNKGISPEKIAVILPDESFSKTLKEFDTYKNLNFAMGDSFRQNDLFKKLDALDKHIRVKDEEHKYRCARLKIEQNIIDDFRKKWRKKLNHEVIIQKLKVFCDEEKKEEVFEEEIFKFSRLLKSIGIIELQKALKLFLNRLSQKSTDDVMGGKVTVMGLLESRGMSYDGVIVVDFSDEFVPKRSKKDMFLSSSIRAHALMPSKDDRENLQRYFYYRLFNSSKEIAISFTSNDQSMPSRFLDELGFTKRVSVDEKSYFSPLFEQKSLKDRYDPELLEGSFDLTKATLSASKLKTILTCKRQFYYKYILKSKEAKMPESEISPADIGNLLHEALYHVLKDSKIVEENSLMIDLRRYLLGREKSLTWNYHIDIWMEHLREFAITEAKRYNDGHRVYELEKSYSTKYQGFVLEGKIDRVDKRESKISIIDYKSGKITLATPKTLEKSVDFQLEFYYLLTRELGELEGLHYYDLKKGKLVDEALFTQKLEKLDMILEELKEPIVDFEKCESTTPCKFCPYIKLCNRLLT